MKFRYITVLILLLSVLSALADKKMTIRNSDTGESFEVSVPDGMRIYEYHSNWLDSIPYLLERARYGEPWAYEALGDCYRYGKGGVGQSIMNALIYYELGGINVEEMAMKAVDENPKDHLSLIYKLINKVESEDHDGILCILDTLNQEQYTEADILKDFLCNADTISLASIVQQNILSTDVATDKMLFTLVGCTLGNWIPNTINNKETILSAVASKFPYIYNQVAEEFFNESHDDMELGKLIETKSKFVSFLEEADKVAMLSRKGAGILYKYYQPEFEAGRMQPIVEDMDRLAILAKLPESETFIFTDK